MKIFVLTHNYNAECGMQNAALMPWMLLPDSSLLMPHTGQGAKDKPLYLPDFDKDIRLFPSLAIRISRLGKDIAPRFAHRYYHEWAACLCARGINMLAVLQRLGMPWGAACSFDGSFVVGEWQEINSMQNAECRMQDLKCKFVLGEESIVWDMAALLYGVDEVLARISADNIMKTGDIIVLGTPLEQSIPARIGSTVSAEVDGVEVLKLRIK